MLIIKHLKKNKYNFSKLLHLHLRNKVIKNFVNRNFFSLENTYFCFRLSDFNCVSTKLKLSKRRNFTLFLWDFLLGKLLNNNTYICVCNIFN